MQTAVLGAQKTAAWIQTAVSGDASDDGGAEVQPDALAAQLAAEPQE
jgi:hypothetical protein